MVTSKIMIKFDISISTILFEVFGLKNQAILLISLYFQLFSIRFSYGNFCLNYQTIMEGKDKTSTNTDYLAAFLVMIGSVLYCVGFIYPSQVKIHPVGNAISRGLTLAIITYIYSRFKGIDLTFASLHNLKWQFNRNIIMFFQGMCFSWSLYYLPLPIAFTINNSSPLFVVILDKLFYGIELNRKQLIWLIIAFIGVILTVNGNQIMSQITGIPENTYT